jgi:hypothetical protein
MEPVGNTFMKLPSPADGSIKVYFDVSIGTTLVNVSQHCFDIVMGVKNWSFEEELNFE